MTARGFGLAFDIERTNTTRSGYRPAKYDMGGIQELFGELRLAGFAAALRTGSIAHLTMVGGDEGRYKNDNPINRAVAIRLMLIHDFGIDPNDVDAVPSNSNTLGNVGIIKARSVDGDIVITSHYHVPRALYDIFDAGMLRNIVAAESFLMLEDPTSKNRIIEEICGPAYAMRCAEEIQGIRDKITKSYASRTDATPITFGTGITV